MRDVRRAQVVPDAVIANASGGGFEVLPPQPGTASIAIVIVVVIILARQRILIVTGPCTPSSSRTRPGRRRGFRPTGSDGGRPTGRRQSATPVAGHPVALGRRRAFARRLHHRHGAVEATLERGV